MFLVLYSYRSAEVFSVPEDPEEVSDEEGAEHEDGGEEGRVGLGVVLLCLGGVHGRGGVGELVGLAVVLQGDLLKIKRRKI